MGDQSPLQSSLSGQPGAASPILSRAFTATAACLSLVLFGGFIMILAAFGGFILILVLVGGFTLSLGVFDGFSSIWGSRVLHLHVASFCFPLELDLQVPKNTKKA